MDDVIRLLRTLLSDGNLGSEQKAEIKEAIKILEKAQKTEHSRRDIGDLVSYASLAKLIFDLLKEM